jgi:hypothetical protein
MSSYARALSDCFLRTDAAGAPQCFEADDFHVELVLGSCGYVGIEMRGPTQLDEKSALAFGEWLICWFKDRE